MKKISGEWSFFALQGFCTPKTFISEEKDKEDQYYDIGRRTAIKEEARMFRRKFITYEQAEIIYSISHRKLRDIAEKAGAVYRINDVSVLINKEILDELMEQFRQPANPNEKI